MPWVIDDVPARFLDGNWKSHQNRAELFPSLLREFPLFFFLLIFIASIAFFCLVLLSHCMLFDTPRLHTHTLLRQYWPLLNPHPPPSKLRWEQGNRPKSGRTASVSHRAFGNWIISMLPGFCLLNLIPPSFASPSLGTISERRNGIAPERNWMVCDKPLPNRLLLIDDFIRFPYRDRYPGTARAGASAFKSGKRTNEPFTYATFACLTNRWNR